MNPFFPFFVFPRPVPSPTTRQERLRDLDVRMARFLAEKGGNERTCPKVLDNVKGRRSKVRSELMN